MFAVHHFSAEKRVWNCSGIDNNHEYLVWAWIKSMAHPSFTVNRCVLDTIDRLRYLERCTPTLLVQFHDTQKKRSQRKRFIPGRHINVVLLDIDRDSQGSPWYVSLLPVSTSSIPWSYDRTQTLSKRGWCSVIRGGVEDSSRRTHCSGVWLSIRCGYCWIDTFVFVPECDGHLRPTR